MHREREHIATVASGYGAFLNALHDEPAPRAATLPRAQARGIGLKYRLVRALPTLFLVGASIALALLV